MYCGPVPFCWLRNRESSRNRGSEEADSDLAADNGFLDLTDRENLEFNVGSPSSNVNHTINLFMVCLLTSFIKRLGFWRTRHLSDRARNSDINASIVLGRPKF